jgi:iron complex outermembrane receptor protein
MSASVLALASPVLAATDAETPAAAPPAGTVDQNATKSTDVGEIVVTGGLRSQKLQDTPLAVSVVTADQFADSGFKEPRELQFLSPSVSVSIQGGNGIYIRGSGTASQNSGTEQSVGMVIDGVLMGFVDDIGGDISDLDHIEVYRGPQGTQFAKNSTAGLISITTRQPEIGVTSLDTHVTYGEHADTSDDFIANIPINDTMAALIAGSYQHREGVFENTARDEKEGLREQYGFKAKYLWEPSERTSVTIDSDIRHELQSPNFPQAWRYCSPLGPTTAYKNVYGTHNLPVCNGSLATNPNTGQPYAPGLVPGDSNDIISEADYAYRHTTAGGIAATVKYPFGNYDFTSITAVRGMARDFRGPSGSGYFTNSYLNNKYDGGQYSQEFRLASPSTARVTWVAGAYFYVRDTHTYSLSNGPGYGAAFAEYPNTIYGQTVSVASAGGALRQKNDTMSDALFADGTWNVTDKFKINAGFRGIYDDVYSTSHTVVAPGVFRAGNNVTGAPNTCVPGTASCEILGTNTLTGLPIYNLVKPDDSVRLTKNGYVYRFSPQYYFTPDVQVYGLVSHGYKGPLIDNSQDDFTKIKPEVVQALEAGIKSQWFDHRLTANVDIFRNKFTNLQLTSLACNPSTNVCSFALTNAPGQLSQGAEFEFRGKVTDELILDAGMTVLDARFTNFKAPCWTQSVINAQGTIVKQSTTPGQVGACYVATGDTTASTNADGLPVINASKYTVKVGATYSHQLSNGYIIDAGANYLWRSDWWSAAGNPTLIDPSYGILNLNVAYSPASGKWKVGAFARNALNKFFYAGLQANNFGQTLVLNPEAVRTIGVSLDFKLR